MGLGNKSVGELVKDAVQGAFNIPEFQRGFVWRSDQVRDLVESLHRDYPIGAMLVWDASDYASPRSAEGAQTMQWIIDGQQRTTAFCILLGSKPYWWPDAASWNSLVGKIDVLANLRTGGRDLEFALANPVRLHDPDWLSVRRVLRCKDQEEMQELAETLLIDRNMPPRSPEERHTRSTVGSLWAIREREVPVISIQHDLEDVAEIFGRLNKAGTRVTEADVTVALIAAYNQSWVRDEFLSFVRDMTEAGFDLDPGVYIRTITGIARGTARLKDVANDFWRSEVRNVWPKTKAAISRTIRLIGDRGLLSAELLPSANSLIPLFTFQERFGDDLGFGQAFRWFLLANADGRYSGSSVTTLSQDLAAIRDASDGLTAVAKLASTLRVSSTFGPDRFLDDYRRDRFGRLVLYLLLFDRGAIDWVSRVRIGFTKDATSLNEGFLPEWHHIFPKDVLKTAQIPEDDWNRLANITVLNEKTNRHRLRAKSPDKYLPEYHVSVQELAGHLVSEEAPLSVSQYAHFISGRAELLADAANYYFDQLAPS